MSTAPFADRLAAAVEARRSQVCLGLDPAPDDGAAVSGRCRKLIEAAGEACAAVKCQLACFERLGAPGYEALAEVIAAAREAGLLVIADGKRGDVPVSAAAYGEAMLGSPPGLAADATTVNSLLGGDALEPLIDAAAAAGAGLFVLVRTSNPGAADILDLPAPDRPLHEILAGFVAERAPRLAGESGLSGMGAVIGATAPQHLARLRELMPDSIFLIPGVGAQGGKPEDLGPALGSGRASILVAVSRSIADSPDPLAAASELRDRLWDLA